MVNTAASEVVAEIYPEQLAKRKLPVNFDQDHIKLFDLDLERTIPPSRLVRLKNVRVSREGIFFTGTKLLPESFPFLWLLEEWKKRSIFKFLVTNYLLRRRRQIDEEILWITDYWSTGYFHWLTDALTRLFAVRDRLHDRLLMLPAGYDNRGVVTSSLKAFGVNNVNYIAHDETLECSSILMPTHTAPSGHFNEEAIRGVREILLSAFGETNYRGPGERIFISRKRADKRRIANEEELQPILEKFDFQIICAEDLSFEEQVKICSRAGYLVSNHGAGLTNALFMNDGAKVLELRHHSDRNRNCFFVMSSALNLNYFYLRCRPQQHDADPHIADIVVDPDEFEKTLHLLLA
jgi:hypothetical protein